MNGSGLEMINKYVRDSLRNGPSGYYCLPRISSELKLTRSLQGQVYWRPWYNASVTIWPSRSQETIPSLEGLCGRKWEVVSDLNPTDYQEWQEEEKSEGKAWTIRTLLKKIKGSFMNVQIHNVV